jgi:hypothetical protein
MSLLYLSKNSNFFGSMAHIPLLFMILQYFVVGRRNKNRKIGTGTLFSSLYLMVLWELPMMATGESPIK